MIPAGSATTPPTSPSSTGCGPTAISPAWTEQGGMIIFGRSDATLNASGVRIGTAEIYRIVEQRDEVIEAIAVAQEYDDDTRIVLFVRLADGFELTDELVAAIRADLRIEGFAPTRSVGHRHRRRHSPNPFGKDRGTRRHRNRARPPGRESGGAGQSQKHSPSSPIGPNWPEVSEPLRDRLTRPILCGGWTKHESKRRYARSWLRWGRTPTATACSTHRPGWPDPTANSSKGYQSDPAD